MLATRGGSGPAQAGAAVSADSVGVFGAASGRRQGEIPVGASPSAIAAGDGSIWVANTDAHTVSRVDPGKETTIDTIPVGNDPDGIAYGGGFVWVTNGLDGTVTQIDSSTNTAVQEIRRRRPGRDRRRRPLRVGRELQRRHRHPHRPAHRQPLPPIPVGQSADGIAIGEGRCGSRARRAAP